MHVQAVLLYTFERTSMMCAFIIPKTDQGAFDMDNTAINIVREYILQHLDKTDETPSFEVYTIWKVKALQNWKYLISSTLLDGMYYPRGAVSKNAQKTSKKFCTGSV